MRARVFKLRNDRTGEYMQAWAFELFDPAGPLGHRIAEAGLRASHADALTDVCRLLAEGRWAA